MNRIYKSIFNAARRCVVCVSKATSSAQGRKGNRVVTESQPLVKPFKKTVLAVALGMLGATGALADEVVCAEGDLFCQAQKNVQPRAGYNLTVNEGETKEIIGERLTIASGGSVGIIANKGMLTIRDGATSAAYGIYYNANGSGSTGTISNTGSGTLTIQGGTETKTAIYYNAYNGGTAIIRNEGEGTLTIQGGSGGNGYGIHHNTYGSGSTGTISNIGSGTLTIQGGSQADGIGYIANSGGSGIITNVGEGNLTIQGGRTSHAIYSNGDGPGSIGTISNKGSGTLTIQGGSSSGAYGIRYNASYGGTGIISNDGEGTLTIQSGKHKYAFGIGDVAYGAQEQIGSSGSIINGENGILNIFGNTDVGNYGIRYLATGSVKSLLENAGVMNLNVNAIGEFIFIGTPTSVSVVNKSTGTVNAEAGAIFESTGQSEVTVNTPIPITIYTPGEGIRVTSLDTWQTEQTVVTTDWKLKDDWYNYSTWEDGGKLVITDVVAGSAEAQTIIDSFQDRFGTGTTIEFTGTGSSKTSSTSKSESNDSPIKYKYVMQLIQNGELKDGDIFTAQEFDSSYQDEDLEPPYGALAEYDSNDSDPPDEDLDEPEDFSKTFSVIIIGDDQESGDGVARFNQSIGFKGAADNIEEITVQNGKTFTLVGEQATMAMALRAENARPSYHVAYSVNVKKDSTLALGIADLSATQGYLEKLNLEESTATLSVENGLFQITNITGEGQINVQEKGQLTIANKATASDVVNKGVLNANTVNTQIGTSSVSTLANEDVNHFETFTNEKGSEANFANVSIAEGSDVKNKAEATINAGSVVLDGGAVITNFADGTLNFDSFEMNGTLRNNGTINVGGEMSLAEGTTTTLAGKVTAGTFSIGRAAQKAQAASVATMTDPQTVAEITGETYSDVLDLAGGDVFVRKDAILAGIDLMDNIVNSKVTVDTDGTFAFSFNENQLEDALKDLKLDTEGKALAVLSTDLSFGETGSLTIGTTDAQETVNLGSDALVLLATDSLHGNAVLNGEGKETLNIKDGAELAFTDNAIWGNHYLVRDFVSMDAAENLTVKDLEGNVLETHYNDKGIYVTIGSNNILDKDVDFGLSNNINAIMDGQQNTASSLADIRYLSMAMGANDGVKQTNDLEHLSAQAGVLSEAYRLTDNAHESIIRHAMSDKYSNVWVEALAGKGGVDGAGTGYGDASYDSDSYGMIFGLDGRIGKSINVGAAIHYQKGDLEADSSQTKNEFKNYGASIYAGTNFGNLNVTAGLTYAKGDHEFNQVNLGYVEGDTNTEVFMGGIRASYPIMVDRILITPYAGIEAVHVKEDGFTATIGGAEAFDFGSVSETFARVPMGVKFSGGNERFAGYADIAVIPQFGNRDAKQSVSGINTHAKDIAKFDYADSVLGRVKMGAAYQVTPSTTLGVSYGASLGDVRDLSHEFSLNAKYRF